MLLAGLTFAALAAVLHVYIFALESLSWTSPRTRAVFGTTAEEAVTTKALAFNQGFYNLFLAIVTVVGIAAVALDHNTVGLALIFAGVCFASTTAAMLFGADLIFMLTWLTTALIYLVLQTVWLALIDPTTWHRPPMLVVSPAVWRRPLRSLRF